MRPAYRRNTRAEMPEHHQTHLHPERQRPKRRLSLHSRMHGVMNDHLNDASAMPKHQGRMRNAVSMQTEHAGECAGTPPHTDTHLHPKRPKTRLSLHLRMHGVMNDHLNDAFVWPKHQGRMRNASNGQTEHASECAG